MKKIKNMLYKSFVVKSKDTGSVKASQFIVNIDYDKKEFTVYENKNPRGYKIYKLSFDYIDFIDKEISGDIVKLVNHRQKTLERKISDYKEYVNSL